MDVFTPRKISPIVDVSPFPFLQETGGSRASGGPSGAGRALGAEAMAPSPTTKVQMVFTPMVNWWLNLSHLNLPIE